MAVSTGAVESGSSGVHTQAVLATPPQKADVKSQGRAWASSAMSRGFWRGWVSAAEPLRDRRDELVGDRCPTTTTTDTAPPSSHTRCKSASRGRNSVAAGGFPQNGPGLVGDIPGSHAPRRGVCVSVFAATAHNPKVPSTAFAHRCSTTSRFSGRQSPIDASGCLLHHCGKNYCNELLGQGLEYHTSA